MAEKFPDVRLLEAKQHRGRFDFRAFAVRGFDLQGSIVVGENRADLEGAFLFVKDVHGVRRWAGRK
jgi:hypothetical protein